MKFKGLWMLMMGLICSVTVFAQDEPEEPAYKRFPIVPKFEILATDSVSIITRDDFKKNKPVLIMYFSPDCDHCQDQVSDILKNVDKLKNVQILLTSYQPLEKIRAFKEKNQLDKYPNIFIGRDTQYFIPSFFDVANLPFLAFYDKKQNLLFAHEGNVKPAKILNVFKGQL
ncbi:MAG TPA: redoxin domain-containing protein [Parasegetibacter sp.]